MSLQARALRYAFLAEREAAHISMPAESPKPRQDHHSSSAQICRRPPAHSTSTDESSTKCDYTAVGLSGRHAGYTVSRIGVVGSGVMGTGIAASLLLGRSVGRSGFMPCSSMTLWQWPPMKHAFLDFSPLLFSSNNIIHLKSVDTFHICILPTLLSLRLLTPYFRYLYLHVVTRLCSAT